MQPTNNSRSDNSSDNQLVRTLARGLRILDVLKDRGTSTLTEIATELAIDKSTVYRLLNTLVELGFVDRDADSQKYRLSVKLIEHGRRVATDLELRRVALPYLERLRETCGETVSLTMLRDDRVVWVEVLEGRNPLRMTLPAGVGAGWIHSTASGKAMLAYLPDQEIDRIYQEVGFPAQTSNTLTTLEALREDLRITRKRGYSLDNMENIDGLRCIGTPLFGPAGKILGAISISAPAFRFLQEVYLALVPVMKEISLNISRSMGADDRTLLAALSPAPIAPA
ncbi:MAG: IclR family transcriptional regulator [Chloroflexi bacterium]|nr:IclR family transcriptional regulator [Chloroflexota bacterium]